MGVVYLKIEGTTFDNKVNINGELLNLLPSRIQPSVELLKNSERSLDGTLNVDMTALVTDLKVRWDIIDNDEFEYIRTLLNLNSIADTEPQGLEVEYFDFAGINAKRTIRCCVDHMTFEPFIQEDELMWSDVEVTLLQLEVSV